jgi:hypothetical protein
MRSFLSALSLSLVLPLAACFDVDMTMAFVDEDAVEGTMVMTASAEFYAMATSSGEPFCDGEDEAHDDGSHTCTETFSGTIDEVLNDPDMGEGMSIERRDDGLLFVSFDLSDLTEDVAPPDEEGAEAEEMKNMMAAAFTGHSITINVAGAEIVETNGTMSDDGTTATLTIPLESLFAEETELPETFDTLLRPGT